MSFLVYCLLLIQYLHAFDARHIGIVNKESNDHKLHIFGKGLVGDHEEKGKHQEASSPTSLTTTISEEKRDPRGNERILIRQLQMVFQEVKSEECKRRALRILLEPKSHNVMETVYSKESDGVVENVVVMDYAQPHRKPPIHNEKP